MLVNRNLLRNACQGVNGTAAPFMQPSAFGGFGYPVGAVKYAQPVVYPTHVNQVNTYETTVVPVIHPQHTQVMNHQMVQMQHYYPQTTSMQTQTACSNQNCGCGR